MRGKELIGRDRKCPVCRRSFIRHEGWVFERTIGHKTKVFCSWSCLRQWEFTHGTKGDRQEKIQRAIKDGLTNREIAMLLDEDPTKINYWRKKLESEKSVEERTEGKDQDAEAEGSSASE